MEVKCKTEIEELHLFFEQWYNGLIDKTTAKFERVTKVLHPKFLLISPNGQKLSREEILQVVWDAHGSRAQFDIPMRIWIKNYQFRQISDSLFLAIYEEWQTIDNTDKGRVSTALFMKQKNNFQDLIWFHGHETWLSN